MNFEHSASVFIGFLEKVNNLFISSKGLWLLDLATPLSITTKLGLRHHLHQLMLESFVNGFCKSCFDGYWSFMNAKKVNCYLHSSSLFSFLQKVIKYVLTSILYNVCVGSTFAMKVWFELLLRRHFYLVRPISSPLWLCGTKMGLVVRFYSTRMGFPTRCWFLDVEVIYCFGNLYF